MSTYFGTDSADSIDGSKLPAGISKIDSKAGNDTLINLASIDVIGGPGNDIISGIDVRYALWRSPKSPTVNLKEGFALDGFGFRDELAGVTTVQLPSDALNPVDAMVIGSNLDEIVFVWAGNNVIDLSGGNDLVIFYDSDYTDFDFNYENDSVIVKNIKTGAESTLSGVETLQFRKDSMIGESYDEYLTRVEYSSTMFTSPIAGFLKNEIHRFSDNSIDPDGRTYAKKTIPPGLLDWEIQVAVLIDLNEDDKQDVVLPIMKGYATGEDTTTPFIAFISDGATLQFDLEANKKNAYHYQRC